MFLYDLRHALRTLVRRPGLSVAVMLILALGIGSTTTTFSIINSALLADLPYKDGDRLVVVKTTAEEDGSTFPSSYLDIQDWRAQSQTLEVISASSNSQQLNLTGEGRAERVGVEFVSASYFDLLGSRPALGRTFLPEDETPTSPLAVTVLSHELWQRRFGGDPTIVGKGIQLHGRAFEVVGVLSEDFRDIYQEVDLYLPVTMARSTHREGYVEDRAVRWLDVFARLRPGVTVQQASDEMQALSRRLAVTFPTTNDGYSLQIGPLRTFQVDFERMRLSFLTLLIGALFVLLVGCTNVTNLLLMRAVERRREVALRLALGVKPFQLVRHFILEGMLLCAAGGLLGIAGASFAVEVLSKLGNRAFNLPAFVQFSLDLRALGVGVALSLLTGLVLGVIPARKSLKVNLQEELYSEGKGHSHSATTAFTRNFLVVSAVFFSVVLLIGAGLMIKSLQALIHNDPGFRVEQTITARFELPTAKYPDDARVYLLYQQVLDQARTLPGVEAAGLWAPGMIGGSAFYKFIVPEGKSLEAPEDQVKVFEHRISPGLLREVGIALLAGREFSRHDNHDSPPVAILSRSTAEVGWPGQDPIGQRFWVGAPQNVYAEVVGVVEDVAQRGRLQQDHDFRRDVYFPLFQMRARNSSLLLRVAPSEGQPGLQLSEMMRSVDPDVPVYDVMTLQERRREEEAGVRLNTLFLIFFAASALILAAIGIYSILAYAVRQQSYEIGIRMALGADNSEILRHFVGRGLTLLVVGLLAGMTVALALARLMSGLLYNVSPFDPVVFILVPCIVGIFSLPAIFKPARVATKADPSNLFRFN